MVPTEPPGSDGSPDEKSGSRYAVGPTPPDTKRRPPSRWVQYGRGAALAFEFTVTVGAAVFIGYQVDAYLGTEPWIMILATIIGVVGGFIRLVQVVRQLDRNP